MIPKAVVKGKACRSATAAVLLSLQTISRRPRWAEQKEKALAPPRWISSPRCKRFRVATEGRSQGENQSTHRDGCFPLATYNLPKTPVSVAKGKENRPPTTTDLFLSPHTIPRRPRWAHPPRGLLPPLKHDYRRVETRPLATDTAFVSAGAKKLEKGHYLFRENDPSDAMYVIKSGKIAIVKSKGTSEIVLAELGPGQMLGEMAFFDDKPRSASAKAMAEAEVIQLPFKSLRAQFTQFPEWLKAMVKTVNAHLRSANTRIKNLEKAAVDDNEAFPPHRITKLIAILTLVAQRLGEREGDKWILGGHHLRNFTIQVFGEPTNKMNKLVEVLEERGMVQTEELSEGRTRIHILKMDELFDFLMFFNEYVFKDESKRTTIEEKELRVLKALHHYGALATPNEKGQVRVSMTQVMNDSMKDLGYVVKPEETGSLEEKKVVAEKTMSEGGELHISFVWSDMAKLYPYWDLFYTLRKVKA